MDLKSLLDEAAQAKPSTTNVVAPASGPRVDVAAWLEAHGIDHQGPKEEPDGKAIWALRCPWSAPDCQKDWPAFVIQFPDGGATGGCHHNGCAGRGLRDLMYCYEPLPEPSAEDRQRWDAMVERAAGLEPDRLFFWGQDVIRGLRDMDRGVLTALLLESAFVYDDQQGTAWLDSQSVAQDRGYAEWLIGKALEPVPVGVGGQGQPTVEAALAFPKTTNWKKYALNDEDRPIPTLYGNLRLALSNLGFEFFYDEFRDQRWFSENGGPRLKLEDPHVGRMHELIQSREGFTPKIEQLGTTIETLCREGSFHPVRRYLDDCQMKWDGKGRVDRWLVDYCGVKDEPHVRAVSRILFVAAVRRVRRPGTPFSRMPILEGEQGRGKSSVLRALVPEPDWFSDDAPLHGTAKDMIEALRGKWIVEVCELDSMSRAEVTRMKANLSRTEDRARGAYQKHVQEVSRCFVLIGTTNEIKYLEDMTGNIRYWPMETSGALKWQETARDRDQLWAEAAVLEAAGESVELDQRHWDAWKTEQSERSAGDPWMDKLHDELPAAGNILPSEIYRLLGVEVARRSTKDSRRIGKILRSLGWASLTRSVSGKVVRVWSVPGDKGLVAPWYRCEELADGKVTHLVEDKAAVF